MFLCQKVKESISLEKAIHWSSSLQFAFWVGRKKDSFCLDSCLLRSSLAHSVDTVISVRIGNIYHFKNDVIGA